MAKFLSKKSKKYINYICFLALVIVVAWYILQPLALWKLIAPWILALIFFVLWRRAEKKKTAKGIRNQTAPKVKRYA